MHARASHRYSRARLRIAGLLLVAGSLLAVSQAPASHIRGATYSGTHAGGGTFQFTVAADGARVEEYRIGSVRGDTCVFVAGGDAGVWEGTPIIEDAFAYNLGDAIAFNGTFAATQAASGTLRLHNDAVPGVKPACSTGTLAWTATTTATPPAAGSLPPGSLPPGSPPLGTPAPGSPAVSPLPPSARTYRTTVLLRTRDRRKLTGRVASSGAGCRLGRTVLLRRGSTTMRSTTSNALGFFAFKRTRAMRGLRIRVTVAARRRPALLCAAGASRSVRLPRF